MSGLGQDHGQLGRLGQNQWEGVRILVYLGGMVRIRGKIRIRVVGCLIVRTRINGKLMIRVRGKVRVIG